MSSVLRRTIYFDSSHDEVRFFDFALVQTTLGTMVEPVSASKLSTYGAQFDPTNELTKIDAMESMNILREDWTKLGAGVVIHGGCQGPRRFDYT